MMMIRKGLEKDCLPGNASTFITKFLGLKIAKVNLCFGIFYDGYFFFVFREISVPFPTPPPQIFSLILILFALSPSHVIVIICLFRRWGHIIIILH